MTARGAPDLPHEPQLAKSVEDLFLGLIEGVAARDGEGGMGLGGKDVALGHGADGGFVLFADAGFGAASFVHVAVDAAREADVGRGVYVNGEMVEREEIGVVEGEDAFDDDHGAGCDGGEGFGHAGVGLEVVDGALNGVSLGEGAEVGDEKLGLEGVGVVKVALVAGVEREPGEVAVIEIEWEEGGLELLGEGAGEGGFAGAGAACDAEDGGVFCQRALFGRAHGFSVLAVAGAGVGEERWEGVVSGGGCR